MFFALCTKSQSSHTILWITLWRERLMEVKICCLARCHFVNIPRYLVRWDLPLVQSIISVVMKEKINESIFEKFLSLNHTWGHQDKRINRLHCIKMKYQNTWLAQVKGPFYWQLEQTRKRVRWDRPSMGKLKAIDHQINCPT